MNTLTYHDLQFVLQRAPWKLLHTMRKPEWINRVFVGGGFIRSVVAGEPVHDVDVFVNSVQDAKRLASVLCGITPEQYAYGLIKKEYGIIETDNAITLTSFKPTIQIVHRWTFNHPHEVIESFDFTVCCAVFWWGEKIECDGNDRAYTKHSWQSNCDDRFYPDVAARRLIYRMPKRNEDAGGSMLRVLKYYQKGYRIPVDSLAAVIARLMSAYEIDFTEQETGKVCEDRVSKIVCGLLREVDPSVDPSHVSHLPAENSNLNNVGE